ncbi:hypothetical protein D3C81_914920 [compost metagenome]
MKAFGQALQATVITGWLQFELRGNGRRQGFGRPRQQQPRQSPGGLQQGLGMADVDHDHTRRQLRLEHKRRQYLPLTAHGPVGNGLAQLTQGIRPYPGLPRHTYKGLQVEVSRPQASHGGGRWQAQRLDAYQPHTHRLLASKPQPPLQYWSNRPARLAQLQVQRLIEPLTATRYQLRLHRPRQHRTGAGIVAARLAVERLHAGPQRSGQPQAGENAEALHAMTPPMAQQRLQG